MEHDGLVALENNLITEVSKNMLIDLLRYFDVGKEFSPVLFEFYEPNGEIRVRLRCGKDAMGVFTGTRDGSYDVRKDSKTGYMIVEPSEQLKEMHRYKDTIYVSIEAKDGDQTKVSDGVGNWNKFTPLDKSQLHIPFERMLPVFEDGWFVMKKVVDGTFQTDENGKQLYEKAGTRITIDASELQRAMKDMKTSGRNYVQLHFGETPWSRSGHLGSGKLDNSSNTVLNAKVEGNDFEFILMGMFSNIIKNLDGEIEIFGSSGKPIVVITKNLPYGRLVFIIIEPQGGVE